MNIAMAHDVDPKEAILKEIGDISGLHLLNTHVLVAIYMRPEKTRGGVILTDRARAEDRYQSKLGLVLAHGPTAFVEGEDGNWFGGRVYAPGDWVVFRPSDGWDVNVRGVPCKILRDTQIKGGLDDLGVKIDEIW
jgi:co-chaperonin GroES (HSP10)